MTIPLSASDRETLTRLHKGEKRHLLEPPCEPKTTLG